MAFLPIQFFKIKEGDALSRLLKGDSLRFGDLAYKINTRPQEDKKEEDKKDNKLYCLTSL